MSTVPIVLTFDGNMSLPAAVCISSMMMSANPDTFYDFYILHSGPEPDITGKDKILAAYTNMRIQYRSVGNAFAGSFEIRGITSAAYFRLLAPELIPEYDRVIYADVDMIFRLDLSDLYKREMDGNYLGAVYALTLNTTETGKQYVRSLGLTPGEYFLSGFLLMDLKKMRDDGIVNEFKKHSKKKYKYQDMDIMNIVCNGRIMSIPYVYSMVDGAFQIVSEKSELLNTKFMHSESNSDPLVFSNIHFNGVKPWTSWCPNLDQWWECYRKSPIYDPEFYFNFFYDKLTYLDQLSLMKRIKILLRFFVFGRKKQMEKR